MTKKIKPIHPGEILKEEFLKRKGKEVWQAILPDGPPPVPKN